MKTTTYAAFAIFLGLSLLAVGCKSESKLEKCNGVCAKILKEELAACSDEACKQAAKDKNEACLGLCDTAVGKGAKKREEGKKQRSEDDKAMAMSVADLTKSCEGGKARHCVALASKYLKGRDGAPKSDKDAAKYLKLACDNGDMFGCTMYGKMLRDGRGVAAKDPAGAKVFFEKACAAKEGSACASLGLVAAGSPDTIAKGVELLTKACDLDDGLGCMGLGALYLHGNGVKKDVAKAKTILSKSCSLGSKSACDKVKTL